MMTYDGDEPRTIGELLVSDSDFKERFISWLVQAQRIGATPWNRYVSREDVLRRCERAGDSLEAAEALWTTIKLNRPHGTLLGVMDERGEPFRVERFALHDLAMQVEFGDFHVGCSRRVWAERDTVVLPPFRREMLREEARATCALDGLEMCPKAAREMFATGRWASTREERAIQQAHDALSYVTSVRSGRTPSLQWLLDLHARLTEGTTSRADIPGRLRRDGDDVDALLPGIAAPAAGELEDRLQAVLPLLARDAAGTGFMTIMRASIAHFAIAYLRPFAEGNGRVARAVYYAILADGEMRRPAQLVALSPLLLRVRKAYPQWVQHVRADENDLGYFMYPQWMLVRAGMVRIIRMVRHIEETGEIARRALPGVELNERQIDTLGRLLKYPAHKMTVEVHRHRHAVVYETARTDLLQLVELGLFEQSKESRAYVFRAVPDLGVRLSREYLTLDADARVGG